MSTLWSPRHMSSRFYLRERLASPRAKNPDIGTPCKKHRGDSMKLGLYTSVGAAVLAWSLAAGGSAFAEAAPAADAGASANTTHLEELVVTARRQEERL